MSEVKVNKITPTTNCGTVTLGDSGDTISIPAGVTLDVQGTTSGITDISWDTTAKTAGFTAVAGNGYFVNTTSGAITVTLPASPSAGDFVGIKDYANTADTNNITIARNGSNIQGTANDFIISTEGLSIILIYVDATQGWVSTGAAKASDIEEENLFVAATGGCISTCGDFKIHTFTGPGTFTVTNTGPGSSTVDYLVVAGGGGSGNFQGAGGGGGGFRESSGAASGCYTTSPLGACVSALPVTATAYPITIGGGGTISSSQPGTQGSSSVFSTITSAGGGFGGGNQFSPAPGGSGGSGGGGGGPSTSTGGTGNTPPVAPPQGQPGANGTPSEAGGGGGATVAGSGQTGGDGAGTAINPSCTVGTPGPSAPLRYFAGGGAGRPGPATAGVGGGGGTNFSCRAGFTNTGGGGGDEGGGGGSGIVIIRYKFQ